MKDPKTPAMVMPKGLAWFLLAASAFIALGAVATGVGHGEVILWHRWIDVTAALFTAAYASGWAIWSLRHHRHTRRR